jgi:hypothetical protein
MEFFGSLGYKIMSSANRNSLTTYLPICIPFISSSCLFALARNSRTMLNRNGETGHPYLIPDFRENGFSFSLLSMMLAIGLSYITFIMLRYIPYIPSFLGAFIMKWCWILSKAFSAFTDQVDHPPSPFFFCLIWLKFCQSCLFFKITNFLFHWFVAWFFWSPIQCLLPWFYNLFLSTTFGIVLFLLF